MRTLFTAIHHQLLIPGAQFYVNKWNVSNQWSNSRSGNKTVTLVFCFKFSLKYLNILFCFKLRVCVFPDGLGFACLCSSDCNLSRPGLVVQNPLHSLRVVGLLAGPAFCGASGGDVSGGIRRCGWEGFSSFHFM